MADGRFKATGCANYNDCKWGRQLCELCADLEIKKCPHCNDLSTVRTQKSKYAINSTRRCKKCKKTYTTMEILEAIELHQKEGAKRDSKGISGTATWDAAADCGDRAEDCGMQAQGD